LSKRHEDELNKEEKELEAVEENRKTFNEMLVTVIILGFALSLLTDLVSSVFLTEYAFHLTLLSVALIIASLAHIFRLQIGKHARLDRKMTVSLLWNSETGEVLDRKTSYFPQIISRTLFTQLNPEDQNRFSKLLKSSAQLAPQECGRIASVLVDGVILTLLNRLASIADQSGIMAVRRQFCPDIQLIPRNMTTYMPMVKKGKPTYRRKPDGSGFLKIKWVRGLAASLEIKYQLAKAGRFEEKPDLELAKIDSFYLDVLQSAVIEATRALSKMMPELFPLREKDLSGPTRTGPIIRNDVMLSVNFRFRPLWFHIRPSRIRAIHGWVLSFVDTLQIALDWDSYKAQVAGWDQGKEIMKRIQMPPRGLA